MTVIVLLSLLVIYKCGTHFIRPLLHSIRSDDFAQMIGFYREVAAEDRYLWPF